MRRPLKKLPPEPDDFAVFRKLVRKAPSLFLAVLIVLGLGAVLSHVAFFTHVNPLETGVFISLKGSFETGGDAGGEDEDEGARGEEEEEPDEPETPAEKREDAEPPLEPSRWLEPLPKPAPLGPAASSSPKPAKGPPPGIKIADTGGGGGKGRKGPGPGAGSPWGNRSGTGRGEAVRRGGNKASESAVERGLNWLRRHQAENGVWRAETFNDRCAHRERCTGQAQGGMNHDVGVTALALMAYLGAGYTHTEGRFKNTVQRTLDYLLAVQKADGRFSSERMYTHVLSVLALAEAYGMTDDSDLEAPLRRGVNFLVRARQPGGGWTYDPEPRYERNDTSISVFAVMALKAARATDIFVPESVFNGARRHILSATREDGTVWYADRKPGWRRGGVGMVAAGLFSALLLGRSPDHAVVGKQLDKLRANVPVWGDTRDLDQCYMTWYYQNLVFFSLGGADWARWNPGFRDLLVKKQRRGGCVDGSWDPEDCWGKHAGRIYATAIHILNLEIYYKYNPAFLLPSETVWPEDPSKAIDRPGSEPRAGGEKPPPKEPGESPKDRLKRLRDLIGGK